MGDLADITAWAKEVASTAGAKPRSLPVFRKTLQEILSQAEYPMLHSGEFIDLLARSLHRDLGTSRNPRMDDAELSLDEFNIIDEEDITKSRHLLVEALRLHGALKQEYLAGNAPDELSIRRIVRSEMSKRNMRAREYMAEVGMAPKTRAQLTERQRQILGPYLSVLRDNAQNMWGIAEPIDLVGVVFANDRENSGAVFTRGKMLRMVDGMSSDTKRAIHCIRAIDRLGHDNSSLNEMMVVIFTDEIVEHDNGDRIFKLPHLPVVTSIKVGEVAS